SIPSGRGAGDRHGPSRPPGRDAWPSHLAAAPTGRAHRRDPPPRCPRSGAAGRPVARERGCLKRESGNAVPTSSWPRAATGGAINELSKVRVADDAVENEEGQGARQGPRPRLLRVHESAVQARGDSK